tara:strand:- start:313 stop:810 length:498 start_codon:yes stop_codon:yes gene_type:complete
MLYIEDTMKLFLIRHGSAEDGSIDSLRNLTQHGRQEASQTGNSLKSYGVRFTEIWHSPLNRAHETGSVIADILNVDKLRISESLKPESNVEDFEENFLQSLHLKELCIVSHLPYIPNLICYLCDLRSSQLIFPIAPASCTILEYDRKIGWSLLAHMAVNDHRAQI